MKTETLHKLNAITGNVSKKYSPVNTEILLKPFIDNGWYKVKHLKSIGGIGKEKITLNHANYIYSNGDSLSVECLNSNDGSGALVLMGGYGRVVCSNGLIIGDIEGARFVHRGSMIYEKLENQYEKIVAHLDKLKSNVIKLQSTELTNEQFNVGVLNVVKAIFEKDTKKYTKTIDNVPNNVMARLKYIHRNEDKGLDAFTRLNVLQENIIRHGQLGAYVTTLDKETGCETKLFKTKRPCENKISSVSLNKTITECFLKLVA